MDYINQRSSSQAGNRERRVFVLLWGLWMLWGFGGQTVWSRLMIDVHGVVVSSIDDPSTGAPRYATVYRIRADDGRNIQYVAGATDASLERSLPVGSRLDKSRWQLDYDVDGRRFSFPVGFYAAVIVASFGAIAFGATGLPAALRSIRKS